MRKRLSKISALLMALVMVLSMSSNVFAASAGDDKEVGTVDDTGTITVSGVDDESTSLTVTAYPILLAYYNASGDFVDYYGLYSAIADKLAAAATGTGVEGLSFSLSDLESVKSTIDNGNMVVLSKVEISADTTYVFGDAAADSVSLSKNADGTWSADVAIGSYLIVIENAETVVYNLAVVSTDYAVVTDEGTGTTSTVISSQEVDMINDGEAWVKAAEPTVVKTIVESGGTEVKGNSKDIGESEEFKLVVSPIPYYGDEENVTFKVTDSFDGLYYDRGTISVYVYDTDKTTLLATLERTVNYDVELVGSADPGYTGFVIDFVDESTGLYLLNNYQGKILVITYSATVNDDANVNYDANTNTAYVSYSNNDNVVKESDKDTTYTYTFDIDGTVTADILVKTEEDGETPLEGATFGVYTDEDCTQLYTNSVFNGYATSDEKGQIYINGLEAYLDASSDENWINYYIKETDSPDGYTLNDTVYTVRIHLTVDPDTGKMTEYTIYINGTRTTSFTTTNGLKIQPTTIKNTKSQELPSTGGYGTMIFTLIGCAVMIISAAAYIKCRDKKAVR